MHCYALLTRALGKGAAKPFDVQTERTGETAAADRLVPPRPISVLAYAANDIAALHAHARQIGDGAALAAIAYRHDIFPHQPPPAAAPPNHLRGPPRRPAYIVSPTCQECRNHGIVAAPRSGVFPVCLPRPEGHSAAPTKGRSAAWAYQCIAAERDLWFEELGFPQIPPMPARTPKPKLRLGRSIAGEAGVRRQVTLSRSALDMLVRSSSTAMAELKTGEQRDK